MAEKNSISPSEQRARDTQAGDASKAPKKRMKDAAKKAKVIGQLATPSGTGIDLNTPMSATTATNATGTCLQPGAGASMRPGSSCLTTPMGASGMTSGCPS